MEKKSLLIKVSLFSSLCLSLIALSGCQKNVDPKYMAPGERTELKEEKNIELTHVGNNETSDDKSTQKSTSNKDKETTSSGSEKEQLPNNSSESKSEENKSNKKTNNSQRSTTIQAKSNQEIEQAAKNSGTFVDGDKDESVQAKIKEGQNNAKVEKDTDTGNSNTEVYINGKKI